MALIAAPFARARMQPALTSMDHQTAPASLAIIINKESSEFIVSGVLTNRVVVDSLVLLL